MKIFNVIKLCILLVSISCVSQQKDKEIYVQEIENNSELKYVLAYVESTIRKNDSTQSYFLKGYKLPSQIEIPNEEGHEKMEYFYFFVSSYDEYPEIDGKLYKTKSFIKPNLTKISFNQKLVLIEIEFIDEKTENIKNELIKFPLF